MLLNPMLQSALLHLLAKCQEQQDLYILAVRLIEVVKGTWCPSPHATPFTSQDEELTVE